ncbi:alpha/beta fold hydrolase [Roseobacter weihaiensis]|uniref:alpha/beta fold hydrolase n=1 Tax=Roseobacter weihaiensis TaxID=2763262 RepID=UPI0029CAC743|nr:alpha/beta hydrolase [Roseobacter sp. H9]
MLTWALILLAGVVAVPLVVEATRKPMNKKARLDAPGSFVTLSQGVTHYQWHAPETGVENRPVIVCIHGLTTPSFVWGSIAKGLAALGFRVLTYDLYGRGYSDRPRGVQDRGFFLRQLNDLLESQKVDDDIIVIGYSMGGAIAAAFAARQPQGIRQVVLLAPAGMQSVAAGTLRYVAGTPIIGLWLMLFRYPEILRKGLREEEHLPSSVPDITRLQNAELDYRGFVPAVHASLLDLLNDSFQPEHETLRQEQVPVLAIWGAADDVIPLSAKETLAGWNKDVQHHVIDGAGHGLPYTHTPQVLARIEAFLQPGD